MRSRKATTASSDGPASGAGPSRLAPLKGGRPEARPRWLEGRPPRLAPGVVCLPSIARANQLKPDDLAAAMAQHGSLWSRRLRYRPSCSSGVFEAVDQGATRWLAAWLAWCKTDAGRWSGASLAGEALERAVCRGHRAIVELMLASGLQAPAAAAVLALTHCAPCAPALVASMKTLSGDVPRRLPLTGARPALQLPLFHAAVERGSLAVVRAVLAHRPEPALWGEVGGKTVLERALLRGAPDVLLALLEASPPPQRPVPETWRQGAAWSRAWPTWRDSGLAALLACLGVVPALPLAHPVLPDRLLGILAAWPHPTDPGIRAAMVHEAMDGLLPPVSRNPSRVRRV